MVVVSEKYGNIEDSGVTACSVTVTENEANKKKRREMVKCTGEYTQNTRFPSRTHADITPTSLVVLLQTNFVEEAQDRIECT